MASITGLTIEDFESLPAALTRNHELVDGELVDVSGNTYGHNRFRDKLTARMDAHVEQHGLGIVVSEQEFEFGENAHGPDISFISAAKVDLTDDARRVQLFVPDLAIEIASTHDKFDALVAKLKRYLKYGAKEVYLFSINNREVYRYTATGAQILTEHDEFHPEQIPGFSSRIADLFAMIER